MKHIDRIEGQQEITIMGRTYYVSEKMTCWAVDGDGELRAHRGTPSKYMECWVKSGYSEIVCNVDLDGTDWCETLTEIAQTSDNVETMKTVAVLTCEAMHLESMQLVRDMVGVGSFAGSVEFEKFSAGVEALEAYFALNFNFLGAVKCT